VPLFGPVRRSFLGPNLQDPSDALRHAFHRVPALAIIVDSKAAIGLATVGVGAIASKDRGFWTEMPWVPATVAPDVPS